jgi:hypothetical protein
MGKRAARLFALAVVGGAALALGPILDVESWTDIHSGGAGYDSTYGVAIDGSGNTISVAYLAATPGSDGLVEKRAPDGTLLWSDVLDNPAADSADSKSSDSWAAVCTDDDDNVIVGGTWSGNYWGGDFFHNTAIVRKYGPTGNVLWTWKGDASYEAWASVRALACDPAGNVYAAGNIFSSWDLVEHQWAVWKFSPDGQLQTGFPVTYDYKQDYRIADIAFALAVYPDGAFVAAGVRGQWAPAADDDPRRDLDWHVRKYNADRTLAWSATFAGTMQMYDYPRSVVIDDEGDVYVAGYTNVGSNNAGLLDWDGLVIKYSGGSGYEIWNHVTSPQAGRHFTHQAALMHPSGNLLVTTNESVIGQSASVCRLEMLDRYDGHVVASEEYCPGTDTALLAAAGDDELLVLGGQRNSGVDYDALTARYVITGPPNHEPYVVESPAASTGLAAAGEVVHFAVTVGDPDDDPLTVTWDFGDGSTGEGTEVDHVFTAPGARNVVMTVSDGQATVEDEVGLTVGEPFVVPSVHANLNFVRTGRDTLSFVCRLPLPADFVREGRELTFTAGGLKRNFVLDRKGQAKTAEGRVVMNWVRKKKQWQLSVNLAKGDYAAEWTDEGLVDATVKKVPVTMKATVEMDGDVRCAHLVQGTYTARLGKFGHLR